MKKKITILAVILGVLAIGAIAVVALQPEYQQMLAGLGKADAERSKTESEDYLVLSENLYITQVEVDARMERVDMFGIEQTKAGIVNGLLKSKALYYYACSIGLEPTDEEVREYIEWNRDIILSSSNRDDILAYIAGTGMTEDEYWDSQYDRMKLEQSHLKLENYFYENYYDGMGTKETHFLEWIEEIYAQVLADEGLDLEVIEESLR
jgi:hypothetical protein